MSGYLTINHYIPTSIVNGPGKRFTIWFQGCTFNCDGCFNKELQQKKGGINYKISDIADLILNTKDIEGVTYTGGEPFLQSKELVILSKILKDRSLTILSYTGFTLKQILKSNDENKIVLLNLLDILIDGKFIKNLPSNKPWIGSSNQRIYFLSDCYKHLQNKLNQKQENIEIQINKKGKIIITGFPKEQFLKNML